MRADLSLEEQRVWEEQEMEKPVNFAELHIDPAPFQLVEKSNLLKVTCTTIKGDNLIKYKNTKYNIIKITIMECIWIGSLVC